jgi:hypothetical protein
MCASVVCLNSFNTHLHTLAHAHRFVVRDFEYNPDEVNADEEEKTALKTDITKKYVRHWIL